MTEAQERKKARERAVFLTKGKKKHGNKFNYDYIPKTIPEDRIVTLRCNKHGKFQISILSHINTKHGGCKECRIESFRKSRGESRDTFIAKCKEVHGDKYDYSKVEYINTFTKVTIECPTHGEFETQPRVHLKGSHCPKCAADAKEPSTANGWTNSDWEKAGEVSKNFDSYKMYVIFCIDEETNEKFIKIGKTFQKVSKRFGTKIAMPYDYYKTFEWEGSASLISKLEEGLHKYYKKEAYIPSKDFGGKTECFNPTIDLTTGVPAILSKLLDIPITYSEPSE